MWRNDHERRLLVRIALVLVLAASAFAILVPIWMSQHGSIITTAATACLAIAFLVMCVAIMLINGQLKRDPIRTRMGLFEF